jgi:hypothetical protein
MKKHYSLLAAALAASVMLSGCNGGGSTGSTGTPPNYSGDVPVTGWGPGVLASFDLGTVDSTKGMYYLTDRSACLQRTGLGLQRCCG